MDPVTENHTQSKCRAVKSNTNRYIYKTLLHPRLEEHCARQVERLKEPENQAACCEIGCSSDASSYIHKVLARLPNNSITCYSRWRKIMRPQPCTNNCRKLRNPESGSRSLNQGRVHQLVIQYKVFRPEHVHRSNIIFLIP